MLVSRTLGTGGSLVEALRAEFKNGDCRVASLFAMTSGVGGDFGLVLISKELRILGEVVILAGLVNGNWLFVDSVIIDRCDWDVEYEGNP